MRALLLAVALAACSKGAPSPAPPNPECGAAVAHARTLAKMPAGQSEAVLAYVEQSLEVGVRVMTERCQQDAWPAAMTDCIKAATTQVELSACNHQHLTKQQMAAMKKQSQAELAKLPPPKQ